VICEEIVNSVLRRYHSTALTTEESGPEIVRLLDEPGDESREVEAMSSTNSSDETS
jgi:hypothetical protein